MPTLWTQSNLERKSSETHKISPWWSKVCMPTMCIQSYFQRKPSDTHKIRPQRCKIPMPTMWTQSKSERKPSETHTIGPWRPKVPMLSMWIQSKSERKFSWTHKISSLKSQVGCGIRQKLYFIWRWWHGNGRILIVIRTAWKNTLKEMLSLTLNSITETCCGMEDEMWNIFFLFVFM